MLVFIGYILHTFSVKVWRKCKVFIHIVVQDSVLFNVNENTNLLELSFWVDVYITHSAVMWLVGGGGVDGWPFRAGRGTGRIHFPAPFSWRCTATPQHQSVLRTYNHDSIRIRTAFLVKNLFFNFFKIVATYSYFFVQFFYIYFYKIQISTIWKLEFTKCES